MPDHPSWPAELVEKGNGATSDDLTGIQRVELELERAYRQAGWFSPSDVLELEIKRDTARSQADALAEALEAMVREFVAYAGEADAEHSGYLLEARSALASYRSKPAPGETK